MSGQGKLFVIDGTDGSGKKTQAKLLVERMRREGYPVETVAFPRYGEKSAGPTEEYLAGRYGTAEQCGAKCASIFYAVDRFAASFDMRHSLEEGRNIVSDRYVSSNMGHQGGKIHDAAARAEFYRWNEELEYEIFRLPRPAVTVILHVPAEIGQALAQKRDAVQDIHQSDIKHLKDAEVAYLDLAKRPGFLLIECVEAGHLLPIEAIHEKVWAAVRPLLQ
jgi:dTMP kinase